MKRRPLLPGENDLVVLAAFYDLPRMDILNEDDEKDVAFLTDVLKRFHAYELESFHDVSRRNRTD